MRRVRLHLVADTIRGHRWGAVLWVAGSGAAMYVLAAAYASELSRAPGGASAMAASIETAARAMRALRWPAERLDTFGGYVTYHNLTLLALFLGLYAAVLGAHAIRGGEDRHSLEEILASGWSRLAVVRDRVLGFVVVLAVIAAGIGLGLGVSTAVAGSADVGGSLVAAVEAALCALTFYGLGLLLSQLTRSARTAAGLSALVMAVLYVFTNVWDQLGPLGAARFVSPFYYFLQSRVLVPGHGFDPAATAWLLGISALLLAAAAAAFVRRDYLSALWTLRAEPRSSQAAAIRRPWLVSVWTAGLERQKLALAAWSAGAAALVAMEAWLEPSVMDMWEKVPLIERFLGGGGQSMADRYMSFAVEMTAPVVAAYAVTHASGWVADLRQGRVELILATPVSWRRLVWERLAVLLIGAAVITVAAAAALAVTAAAVGAPVSVDGLVRFAADTTLLGAALGAVAGTLVAWLRGGIATALLAAFVAASYILTLVTPLLSWPEWVGRFSIFGAYGRPYLEMPAVSGIVYLAALAAVGSLVSAAIAMRSPKTS